MPGLKKIQKRLVVEDVESQLREAVLSGALPSGEVLAEANVATQLGVSRASVRQAKFQLLREGLLDLDDRGTARVHAFTEVDVREILEFRQALELAAVRLACKRLSRDMVAAMEDNLHLTEQASDLLELTHLDIAFHEEIVRAAGNSRLLAAWRMLLPQLEMWLAGVHRRHGAATDPTREETAQSHRELLVALQNGDPDAAEQIARLHAARGNLGVLLA